MGIVDNWNNTIKLGSRFKSSIIKYNDVCVESLFEIATFFSVKVLVAVMCVRGYVITLSQDLINRSLQFYYYYYYYYYFYYY